MKRPISLYIAALLLITAHLAAAEYNANDRLKTIGFADPRGGRGGEIIRVTTLNSEGPGSLRAALEAKGPRVVVFEVAGVIDLHKKSLTITEPFMTIAGQTAPSPGITIIRGPIYIKTHDILIQHIRVRPGDAGEAKRSGWEVDGISTDGGDAYNIIIDHCSISWATDENLSASGPRSGGPDATSRRITFSNCIIAECLSESTHKKGGHSCGSLIHDWCRDIAIIGNLYAHNNHRNPLFKANTTGVIANNLIYNAGKEAIHLAKVDGQFPRDQRPDSPTVSVVGNVLIHGESSRENLPLVYNHPGTRSSVYMEDNLSLLSDGTPGRRVSGDITRLQEKPVWPEGLQAMPAKDVVDYVVKHAGARPRDRDETDKRIIKEFLERKGRIINSQDDVGGYPKHKTATRRLDIPVEDIDAWLDKLASELE